MVAAHVHDAIAQVRRLQSLILARKNFKGYSGTARLCGALLALGAALALSSPAVGTDPRRHLAGWCAVLALALLANYGALAGWAANSPAVRFNPMALLPILDALPPLAVVSALCAAGQAVPFTALRETCRLTDGNLNRHLKVLEEAGAVRIRKRFVAGKPRTTVQLTASGLDRFSECLSALNEVLTQAAAIAAGRGTSGR